MNEAMLKSLLLKAQAENGGFTLEKYNVVKHASGYQYSTTENGEYNMFTMLSDAMRAVRLLHGNAGVWYSGGFWYVESSYYSETLSYALSTAKLYRQQCIYDWGNDSYIYIQ